MDEYLLAALVENVLDRVSPPEGLISGGYFIINGEIYPLGNARTYPYGSDDSN